MSKKKKKERKKQSSFYPNACCPLESKYQCFHGSLRFQHPIPQLLLATKNTMADPSIVTPVTRWWARVMAEEAPSGWFETHAWGANVLLINAREWCLLLRSPLVKQGFMERGPFGKHSSLRHVNLHRHHHYG